MTLTGEQEVRGPELLGQHRRWADARERLWHSRPPAPKPARPRPVNPFIRERREAEARKQAVLDAIGAGIARGVPTWRRIVNEVARKHGVFPGVVLTVHRLRDDLAMIARDEAFARIRAEVIVRGSPMSLPRIAERFGGLDHTTVLAGIRRHRARCGEAANAQ